MTKRIAAFMNGEYGHVTRERLRYPMMEEMGFFPVEIIVGRLTIGYKEELYHIAAGIAGDLNYMGIVGYNGIVFWFDEIANAVQFKLSI